jgi:hypothetical protein
MPMKTTITAAIASLLALTTANAGLSGQTYDKNLEAAAAKAFAARAGSIRGTFDADEKPVMVTSETMEARPRPLGAERKAEQALKSKGRVKAVINAPIHSSFGSIGE